MSAAPTSEDDRLGALRDGVVSWYRRGHRDLPWRRTRDPYAVWVSEIMLQQTRVDTVIPRFTRWMTRFPTVEALSRAALDDVLAEWSGLGYYARARNLHAAARMVDERYGGALPDDPKAISSLPGIGRYTAGAILSIAFGRPVPVLDGNVERVLCRYFHVAGDPKAAPARARLWSFAERLARGQHNERSISGSGFDPSELNQGLMELGAIVCTPRRPTCLTCPASPGCAARREGDVEDYPGASRPQRVTDLEQVCIALVRRGRVLLARRPPYGLWGGLFELPVGEPAPGEALPDTARRIARERVGLDPGLPTALAPPNDRCEQLLSHRRITFRPFRAEAPAGRVHLDGYDAHRWVSLAPKLPQDLGVSRATTRLLAALATTREARP